MTETQIEFSLGDLIHPADAVESTSKECEADRYWLHGEEVFRDKPWQPWLRNPRCFIVLTGPARGGTIKMPFKSSIPVVSTGWDAPVTGTATISCKQSDVLTLLRRWTLEEAEGKKPGDVFRENLLREISNVASDCDERAITNEDGTSSGGELTVRVSDRIRRRWGLIVDLWFELDGRRDIRREEFSVEARVRLEDPVKDFPVNATIEFASKPLSMLRTVASRGRDKEIQEAFQEVLKDCYKQVTMDGLLDPATRERWLPELKEDVRRCGIRFGRATQLAEITENPPALPGATDEIVNVSLPERLINGEPDPVSISMTATLRRTSSSKLLKALAPRPGRSFNQEFEAIARSIFGPLADSWVATDYEISNRSELERRLTIQLSKPADGYGYMVARTAIKTSLDPEGAQISATASLLRSNFRTAQEGVTVEIEVTVKLTFAPGQRARKTIRELLDPYADEIRKLIESAVAARQPTEVYIYWFVPSAQSEPLHTELKRQIEDQFRTVAYNIEVIVQLHGQTELLQRREQILRAQIQQERIPLIRENVPGEITVSIHAPVTGIAEKAWNEMARLLAIGGTWDPISALEPDLTRMAQKAFRVVMESSVQERVSKRHLLDLLAAAIAKEVKEAYLIDIRPDIVAYSSKEVIAFFEYQAKAQQQKVQEFFEVTRALGDAIHQKKLDRLKLISEGRIDFPKTKEIETTIKSLEEELSKGEDQTRRYQKDYQDALYFQHLLTVPTDEAPSSGPANTVGNKELAKPDLEQSGQPGGPGSKANRQDEPTPAEPEAPPAGK